ncbi:MAG TPA: hypothetical protein PLI05_10440 [Methanotrichaceae archaeon]|nr:hypothetical protein [Methanotrichaceae archaeon]HQF17470.1 hypothetical protein [Methanotrichaceae archaeon]HQI92014.1 hypothetical protein [Methanotrichaceae archaeon]HQJ29302.1 hypothetical protein [Methanotrichaceae archaeon]
MSRIGVLWAGVVVALLLSGVVSCSPDEGRTASVDGWQGEPGLDLAGVHGLCPGKMCGAMMQGRFFGGPGDGKALVSFRGLDGFAIQDDLAVAVRLHVEKARPVAVTGVRELLSSNKTLGEIRELIRMEEASASYRGVLLMGESAYRLLNIQVKPKDGNNSTLEADLAGPLSRSEQSGDAVVGHLIVNISEGEQVVSQGVLIMTEGQYLGEFSLLLEGLHQMQPHSGGPSMLPGPMDGGRQRSTGVDPGPGQYQNTT